METYDLKAKLTLGGGAKVLIRLGLIVGAVIGGVLVLAAPIAFYLAVAWVFGLLPNAGITWGFLAGGAALALVTAVIVSIMGESLIEDVVKFVLIGVPVLALWNMLEPHLWAIALGAPCGAFLPLISRMFSAPFRTTRGRSKA